MPNATTTLHAPDMGYSMVFQMAGGLFLVLALLLLASYFLRRYGHKLGVGANRRTGLELLGQLPLGPRRGVAVVRYLDRVLVLGVTEHQVNLLTETIEEKEPAGLEDEFADVLDSKTNPAGRR